MREVWLLAAGCSLHTRSPVDHDTVNDGHAYTLRLDHCLNPYGNRDSKLGVEDRFVLANLLCSHPGGFDYSCLWRAHENPRAARSLAKVRRRGMFSSPTSYTIRSHLKRGPL
ncbi:hypothetical protein BDU57DRAFT_517257 [Ampelomyces quisqualis]|uniref:Uncharacterized protein n=1 Tax=Ampelomyces quisqualis TaxID=50730 RepID=A0A6A5QML1_AMPQU|nr:hypothetical protein BDU57DRAFT_517257 [Ampelomyces quisqualis]